MTAGSDVITRDSRVVTITLVDCDCHYSKKPVEGIFRDDGKPGTWMLNGSFWSTGQKDEWDIVGIAPVEAAAGDGGPTDEALINQMRESTIRRAIGPTILLGSGSYFDFEDPENSEITLEDVAYGLAFAARCAGHCVSRANGRRVFYSVAEHCVRMSYSVSIHIAMQALWHEAGEAVCGDMTAPLKSLIPTYKAIEKRCEAAIQKRFGIEITDPVAIKEADLRMLATERRDLMPWNGERWTAEEKQAPFSFQIEPWTSEEAADQEHRP